MPENTECKLYAGSLPWIKMIPIIMVQMRAFRGNLGSALQPSTSSQVTKWRLSYHLTGYKPANIMKIPGRVSQPAIPYLMQVSWNLGSPFSPGIRNDPSSTNNWLSNLYLSVGLWWYICIQWLNYPFAI